MHMYFTFMKRLRARDFIELKFKLSQELQKKPTIYAHKITHTHSIVGTHTRH